MPNTEWVTGDVITAERLNAMMPLVVRINFDTDYRSGSYAKGTMDKTWREIRDAINSGRTVLAYEMLTPYGFEEDEYDLADIKPAWVVDALWFPQYSRPEGVDAIYILNGRDLDMRFFACWEEDGYPYIEYNGGD